MKKESQNNSDSLFQYCYGNDIYPGTPSPETTLLLSRSG